MTDTKAGQAAQPRGPPRGGVPHTHPGLSEWTGTGTAAVTPDTTCQAGWGPPATLRPWPASPLVLPTDTVSPRCQGRS